MTEQESLAWATTNTFSARVSSIHSMESGSDLAIHDSSSFLPVFPSLPWPNVPQKSHLRIGCPVKLPTAFEAIRNFLSNAADSARQALLLKRFTLFRGREKRVLGYRSRVATSQNPSRIFVSCSIESIAIPLRGMQCCDVWRLCSFW